MAGLLPLTILLVVSLVLGGLALKDHRRAMAARRGLLDPCRSLIGNGEIRHGADGFPKLLGHWGETRVLIELVPDTMTIRRLPQLWLSVTQARPVPIQSEFAILVRPSGNDFFSLTDKFSEQLRPPPLLPWEVLIRGCNRDAQKLLDSLERDLAEILRDPRIKEVAVTKRGLRLVRQSSEGRRGEHLLLRQAVFDDATVDMGAVRRSLEILDRLYVRLSLRPELVAAE